MGKIGGFVLFVVLIGLGLGVEGDNHKFKEGDHVPLYANKVGPFHNPSETYRFYDLPFCTPEHVHEKKEALGEVLNGDRLVDAPYELNFREDKQSKTVCKKTLSKQDVAKLRDAVSKDYYFQMYYDDLPFWGFMGKVEKDKLEPSEYKYLLFKHIHFDILYNNDRVIEINVQTDPNLSVDITDDKEVDMEFSYSVTWKKTDIPFDKRMEKYSKSSSMPQHLEIHWFSIINSCVTVLLLTGFLATILMRVLKNDFIKKRAKPAITLRPTASFGAYHDFMRNLVTHMGPRHFAAYEDSVFRHYVQFGPPGVDLPTFEHILSQWDKKSKKFVFTDRNDGEEIACSFNLEWVMEHTWFSNEGLHVDHNRDRKNRIWSRFFDKPEARGSSSIAPPKGGPTRRNVEDLLLKLGPAAVDADRARGPRDLLHKKKRRAEDDDIPIDALDIDEDAEQPNDAVEQMEWPQQVIYWKSIAAMNEALRRENENKFKDTLGTVGGIDVQYEGDVNKSLLFDEANKESEAPPTGRASPQPLFSDIHKESEDDPPGELPPPEASAVDKALEAEINEGEKVSPPAKELLTCTCLEAEINEGEKVSPPAKELLTCTC
ncbi:uncharacterized protein A4U43_C07F39630 [Asparagus officinalis]|uniref:Transmembrane 9 superfamily member n=1 Tax=Asparagus officinalis TaxID=4686 RepID=A0A5P1EIT0_ASPOF|nr:uncharacterized protein A4U43_C07F39630 [Asparagus officinalis]